MYCTWCTLAWWCTMCLSLWFVTWSSCQICAVSHCFFCLRFCSAARLSQWGLSTALMCLLIQQWQCTLSTFRRDQFAKTPYVSRSLLCLEPVYFSPCSLSLSPSHCHFISFTCVHPLFTYIKQQFSFNCAPFSLYRLLSVITTLPVCSFLTVG